jgi:hypothetical protein
MHTTAVHLAKTSEPERSCAVDPYEPHTGSPAGVDVVLARPEAPPVGGAAPRSTRCPDEPPRAAGTPAAAPLIVPGRAVLSLQQQ